MKEKDATGNLVKYLYSRYMASHTLSLSQCWLLSYCFQYYTFLMIRAIFCRVARRPVYTYEISGRYDIGGLESYLHCCSNYRPPSNQSQTL